MATSVTQKILLTGLRSDEQRLLDELQDFGLVQLESWRQNGDADASSPVPVASGTDQAYHLAQVKFALELLGRYDTRKAPLKQKLLGQKLFLTKEEFRHAAASYDFSPTVTALEQLEAEYNDCESRIERATSERVLLEPWHRLPIPGKGAATATTRQITAELSVDQYDAFLRDVQTAGPHIVQKIVEGEKNIGALITYRRGNGTMIQSLLAQHGGQTITLPQGDVPPAHAVGRLTHEIQEAEQKKTVCIEKIRSYLPETEKLQIVHDALVAEVGQQDARQYARTTRSTFSLVGWIDPHGLDELRERVTRVAHHTHVETLPTDDDEQPPVALRNGSFVKPFESVTGIYGVPQANEPDPTPFLAGFFIIFFGLALTDAGYGLFLALLSALAIRVLKIPKEGQRLFRLFIFGGIITFILGALFGGWFGIDLLVLPEPIQGWLTSIQVINPVSDPISVLLLTFALGVVQILVGLAIDIWWKAKHGKVLDGLLDSGVWMFFIGAILYWVLANVGVLPGAATAVWFVYAGAALLVLTQGRKGKNIILKALGGIMSLYNLVGYFSDVLSYSRLLALGLATGIIASVVNLVALLTKDMLPFVGWVFAIAIIVGGHVFNLAINVLGAYIHAGRLQFVEFFPKFMEGGGRRFLPFTKEYKFVRLTSSVTSQERSS